MESQTTEKPIEFPKSALPYKVVMRCGKENEKDESVWVSMKKNSASGKQFALL
jgi:hypothetical protein